jgi:hypothetical protein
MIMEKKGSPEQLKQSTLPHEQHGAHLPIEAFFPQAEHTAIGTPMEISFMQLKSILYLLEE